MFVFHRRINAAAGKCNNLLQHLAKRSTHTDKVVSLFSIPCNLGQPFLGPDLSPKLLKDSGLLQLLTSCGWRVKNMPDIVGANVGEMSVAQLNLNAKNISQIGATCEVINKQVYLEAKSNNFVLIIGGDHCIPIGTITGLVQARPSTGVIWIDAHADLNTPETSGSGNMHGMPLAFLLGLVDKSESYPNMDWFRPCLKPEDVVYIGLRDLDTGEKEAIKRLGIKTFTMYDIDKLGIGKVMERTVQHLEHKTHLHLSFDIDALDPFFAPHTGTAVRGGLTFREGNFICEYLSETGRLTSMELVEINPSLHTDVDSRQTVEMALTLVGSTMGQTIL